MTVDSPFLTWLEKWMNLAAYTGVNVPDVESRIDELIALWRREIPGDWKRDADPAVTDPAVRYRRGDHAGPKPGSEHELERELLDLDPALPRASVFGERIIDGINAVPLSKDPDGRRRGNVEADMLLLTDGQHGQGLLLVEAKTTSNNAWYAVVENLRQLRLFTASEAAQDIMARRNGRSVSKELPATALVLAPREFYAAPGAKAHSLTPARKLIDRLATELQIEMLLGAWDRDNRAVCPVTS